MTQFSVNLNTLTSGNILYDDFELSQHSRLYAVFQALKEGNIDSVKDLVRGIQDPVSVSVEKDGDRIQLPAPLTDSHLINFFEEEQIAKESVFNPHLCIKY